MQAPSCSEVQTGSQHPRPVELRGAASRELRRPQATGFFLYLVITSANREHHYGEQYLLLVN